MQQIIQEMLAVQRELQESQIRLKDQQERERESLTVIQQEMNKLIELSNQNERRIQQLIGYSITGESDRLNNAEKILRREQRVSRLEQQN